MYINYHIDNASQPKVKLLQAVNESINSPLIQCRRRHYNLHLPDRKLRYKQVRQTS